MQQIMPSNTSVILFVGQEAFEKKQKLDKDPVMSELVGHNFIQSHAPTPRVQDHRGKAVAAQWDNQAP